MAWPHLINILIHVLAGTIALIIGFTMLVKTKGSLTHRRLGRIFCYFTLVVCSTAIIGTLFFRFIPVFAVLSILVPYQLISGWRLVYTQASGPQKIDAIWTLLALSISIYTVPFLLEASPVSSIVVYSTLGGLAMILFYDTIRWLFPKRWYSVIWKYEHSYKLIASIFAMLSALVGNVIRVGQPWSQIAPSAIGFIVILYFFYRLSIADKNQSAHSRA